MKIAEKKVWTYEDYLKLDDEKRYEIIEGEIHMSPAPEIVHQLVLQNLFLELSRKLGKQWLVIISPVDVVLNEENIVQPDIVVVKERHPL